MPGSAHGYDVVDHTRVSAELGGRDGLVRARGDRPRARPRPRRRRRAQPHGAGRARARQRPAVGRADATAAAPRTRTGSTSTGTRSTGSIGLPVLWESARRRARQGRPAARRGERPAGAALPRPRLPGRRRHLGRRRRAPTCATVLARQHYRLAGWRDRDEVLNYRRFFDVDTLIAVRVEERRRLRGHPRAAARPEPPRPRRGLPHRPPRRAGRPRGLPRAAALRVRPGTAIWVEKILEGDEVLPDWACDGTTGYDATRGLPRPGRPRHRAGAVDGAGRPPAASRPGRRRSTTSKRQVVADVLVPERRRLLRRRAEALPEADPDAAARGRRRAARRRLGLPRLRAPRHAADELARGSSDADAPRPRAPPGPTWSAELRSSLERPPARRRRAPRRRDFAVRFQQTWGPVMAKGIEDTAFYRWHRLVALNEVGGDPDLLDDAAPEQLHAWALHQQQHWPLGMTTLSTHDTKRSEDVRARLLAVAGDAESWGRCSRGVRATRPPTARVDAPTAHLVWQTLAGAWRDRRRPADGVPHQGDARVQAAHARGSTPTRSTRPRPRPRPRRPTRRPARRARADRRRPQRRGGPGAGARPEAAPADPARRPRRLPGHRAGRPRRWSTPTTAGPVDYDDRRARLARLRDGSRPATSTTRSCSSPTRRCAAPRAAAPASATSATYQPLVGTSRAPGRLRPRRRGRRRSSPAAPQRSRSAAAGATRRSRCPTGCGATC